MTELEMEVQELRRQVAEKDKEIVKCRETLHAVQDALQWTRDKLIDAQEELRHVKLLFAREAE